MRVLGLVLLACVAGGCTSVKMVQRDGCWVRRTEKSFGRVVEDVGPCVRPQPKWVEDRLTRLVQECVAQADYRWQVRAMEAWSKRSPYPAQPPQQEILHTCMEDARVGLVTESETLKSRLAEVAGDREVLRQQTAQDHAQLRASHDRIAQLLGDAAQKPAGTATATGRRRTRAGRRSRARAGPPQRPRRAPPSRSPRAARARRSRPPRPTRSPPPARPPRRRRRSPPRHARRRFARGEPRRS